MAAGDHFWNTPSGYLNHNEDTLQPHQVDMGGSSRSCRTLQLKYLTSCHLPKSQHSTIIFNCNNIYLSCYTLRIYTLRCFFLSFYRQNITRTGDGSRFGRWSCQCSLCVIVWVTEFVYTLWTRACSVWPTVAGVLTVQSVNSWPGDLVFDATHPHTHRQTRSHCWASSLTSISCSVHVTPVCL